MVVRKMVLIIAVWSCLMAGDASAAAKDPTVMQIDVNVGQNGALFLTQLHDAATAHGFAMRVSTGRMHKHHKVKAKGKHAQPLPNVRDYAPTLIEIWRGDLKVIADNAKTEGNFHFDLYNWILTPNYVIDKTISPYRNLNGTPCEEFTQVLQMAITTLPGAAVAVVQPETQNTDEESDASPEPLRQLQVTVSANRYGDFIGSLRNYALAHEFAVYSDGAGRGVHDSYYRDELLVTVTSDMSGDLDFVFYDGGAGNTSLVFNGFLKGLKAILDDIPYAIIHEQKPYVWPTPEKESY